MNEQKPEPDPLTRRIEEGEYFKQAREWYSYVYIGPISQRIFFIIVTCIAVMIFLMSISSVYNLLPIRPVVPFVYRNDDMMNRLPQMQRLKAPDAPINPALIEYYLTTYVHMRESYNAREFKTQQAFVRQHSSTEETREYMADITQTNPYSPIRRYGRFRDVIVRIRRAQFSREQPPYRATVDFSTIVVGTEKQQKTDWTATITFDYTDLHVRNRYDETISDYVLDYDEPTFRVLSYEKRERLSTSR